MVRLSIVVAGDYNKRLKRKNIRSHLFAKKRKKAAIKHLPR